MDFSINLPPTKNNSENYRKNNISSVVVIGANGSGKSRLGHWIEYNQDSEQFCHRISAQRTIEMSGEMWSTHYSEAEKSLFYGTTSKRRKKADPKYGRWGEKPITSTLWDFDEVLNLLYAYEAKRNFEYVEQSKRSKTKRPIPSSQFDILKDIWNKLFPHRKIKIDDTHIIVTADDGKEYPGSELSDGERVALYLIGHCLCAPPNSTLIIDEPEIHIHKSLQSALWDEMEEKRDDCCFVYLTHELDFAASRTSSDKIWLKSYNGEVWDWEFIPEISNVNEGIVLEILGSRKPVLFIEGEKSSFDHKIYQVIYSKHLVIPMGGCRNVIDSTKAFRKLSQLHHLSINGLIDRDFKPDNELEKLKNCGIYTIDVAEIENLLCVPELIEYVAKHQALCPGEKQSDVLKFVKDEFKNEIDYQVSKKTAFEIKYHLSSFNDKSNGIDDIEKQLSTLFETIDAKKKFTQHHEFFSKLIESDDYIGILRAYNRKNLAERISPILGLGKSEYPKFLIRLLSTSKKHEIRSIFQKYTPSL